MARNNVQTTVTVGMDVQLAKRNANALKEVIIELKNQLKEQRALMDNSATAEGYKKAAEAVDNLILKIKTLEKVQRSATPATAYEAFISGDVMNSNKLRQAQRGAKNRLNTVPSGASDQTARTLINGINRAQVQLNRLQAGFQKPLQSVKKELRDLSGNELQRLLQLLKQEQTLVQGNDKAWAAYAAAIGKVEERMREYDTLARQQMGASTLSRSQRGGFAQANERDLQRAIDKLREYRAVINDPNGTGKATWEATTREILKLQTSLDTLKQKAAEMSGQTMKLKELLRIGADTGKGSFKGTTEQLTLAKRSLEEMQQKVIKGGYAWRRMQESIDNINLELKRTGFISKEVDAILKAPKGRSFNELKQAVEQGRAALQNMRTVTAQEKKDFDELAKKVKEAEFQMKELGGASKGTASAWDKAWSRLKTYIGLYMGAAVAIQKLTATFGDLMDLSDKMGEVRKTTGFTADEVGRLSEELKKMDTRTTLTGLMDLSVTAGQLGLKTQEDVLGFTEAANKLMVALPEMGKEGATEMLKVALATGEIDKIHRQMEQGLIDGSSATAVAMEKVGSTIDRLRATSAATAPAITDFVKRVGAVGAQSGISIDQVAALGSTVDALGMRVEMSATALSRMMPAIRNNAFDIAKILGVTPNTIRELYDTGQGMEVILMILQRMKDSNMDADSIEQMLGMGGMKEIMKELNQQGARAGIVFGGLSQNVDELRRQLGVAKQAYEENIAIQQEYNKMNETTAAKWERLKNQVEEMFVGDESQRWLGKIIDGLRWIVDFIAGKLSPALNFLSGTLKTILIAWATFKIGLGEGIFVKAIASIRSLGQTIQLVALYTKDYISAQWALVTAHTAEEKAAAKARIATIGLNDAIKANIFMAAAAAIGFVISSISAYIEETKKADAETGRFNQKLSDEKKALDNLFTPLKNSNLAQNERSRLISEINSKYGRYLGFMLSETNSAIQLANAHALIAKRIREEAYEKRILDQENAVRDAHSDDVNAAYTGLSNVVRRGARGTTDVVAVTDLLKDIVDKNLDKITRATDFGAVLTTEDFSKTLDGAIERLIADGKLTRVSEMRVRNALQEYMREAKQQDIAINEATANTRADLRNVQRSIQGDVNANLNSLVNAIKGFGQQQRDTQGAGILARPAKQSLLKPQWGAGQLNWQGNAGVQANVQMPLPGEMPKVNRKNIEDVKRFVKAQDDLRGYLEANAGRISQQTRATAEAYLVSEKELEELRRLIPQGNGLAGGSQGIGGGTGGGNIWGNEVGAESTDYGTWDVNELVARRNQMNKFKNVLKPGIDVRKVLAEDRALMKAIDEGKVGEDWQSVLNWYNAERKKIQEELKSERFSTNEGNWRDEKTKKGRRRVNPLVESDYALAELDRYYSRRKEALEKARSEENISEELYNRQAEMLEQEHLERRSKLRGTFTGEVSKEEITAFRKWWAELEKMGELDHVPWATVESEWSKAIAAQIGRNNLKMQQDMTQVESITMKHVNQIAKIIAKERPYDGITENLQANLTKLDILFADLGTVTKQQLEDGSLTKELSRRLSFLLGEAEHAYSLTAEQIMTDMGANGFKTWADAIANAENADELKQRLLAQLRTAYDAVQDAIKKEANQIKRQAEIQWNDTTLPNGKSQKQNYEALLSALGLQEDQVKRANQLIGAGQASERVADKLAIKQMQIRLAMQEQYYALMRKIGEERIAQWRAAGKLEDAEHLKKSLNLALSEEQKKLDEQRVAIQNQLEESQNRLYTELKSWADLFGSSLQSLFEAAHAWDKEYYNERAKLNLTGKGGPGAGTYVIIDNAGTRDAEAHYEYLDEREALERQREIEHQNALAEAWRKVMDDINMKMSETITDQINAMLQNASIDANTQAVLANTKALYETAGQNGDWLSPMGPPAIDVEPTEQGNGTGYTAPWQSSGTEGAESSWLSPMGPPAVDTEVYTAPWEAYADASSNATKTAIENNQKAGTSTQSMFAKMTAAANLYGIAYQAMSNDNLSTTQKIEMIAVQAAGQAGIAMLTADLSADTGKVSSSLPAILAECLKINPIYGAAIFAALTAVLGGLMGMAVSKIAKSKSEIAQATGVSSASAGRLATGMLTYAEGNVNEFTDPSTLREGRMYNVDSADGHTYRARYMGRNPKTHLTNGPEFHLSGERGREMIIDAGTTRQITMNDKEIWHAIQTLSGGGSLRVRRRQRAQRGVAAFAEGNVEEFMDSSDIAAYGTDFDAAALQASLDRNSAVQEALLERLSQPIQAKFDVHGPGGLVDSYDRGKKTANRHGERY